MARDVLLPLLPDLETVIQVQAALVHGPGLGIDLDQVVVRVGAYFSGSFSNWPLFSGETKRHVAPIQVETWSLSPFTGLDMVK
jgi:hypothetical protein